MVASCPVCGAPVVGSAKHCPRCGFPLALAEELGGPLPKVAEGDGNAPEAPPLQPVHAAEAAVPEAEVNAALAHALQDRTELLRAVDRNAPDVTGELCEAALNEASGRIADAQQVLRSAQGRLDRETEELLGRHLEDLEARGRTLEATGLRVAFEDELAHLAEDIVAGDPAMSVAALLAAERRMDGLESHWRGLQGLIAQVVTLQQQAADLGIRVDRLPDRLTAARASLASMPATEHDLDVAAQSAAEVLMRLHEAIPPALEQELGRHAATLEKHRGRPARAQTARHRHAEAVDHLKAGRLEDAVRSVRELRQALDELAKEVEVPAVPPRAPPPAAPPPVPREMPVPASAPVLAAPAEVMPPAEPAAGPSPPPAAPTAPAAPAPPPDATTVEALMKKARSLAVRVRSLPPDSPEAETAALQIHEATELLRTRRYAEADAALSRLMRALTEPSSRS